jgi:hypothetical protein
MATNEAQMFASGKGVIMSNIDPPEYPATFIFQMICRIHQEAVEATTKPRVGHQEQLWGTEQLKMSLSQDSVGQDRQAHDKKDDLSLA